MSRSKKSYEVVDDTDDDLPSRTITLKDKEKQQDSGNDADFDELPNGIKFDESDNPIEEDDEDFEEPRSKNPSKDEDEEDDELDADIQEDDSNDEEDDDIGNVRDKSEFTKRLMRERRLREEAELDAEAHKRNYDALNKRVVDIEATVQSRISAEALQRQEGELNNRLLTLRAQKKAAIEAGETDQQILLDEEIADVVSDIKQGRRQQQEAEATAKEIAKTKTEIKPAPNRHLTRWMRQNGDAYRTDDEFRAAAQIHDRNIKGEGYDENSPEYFEELSKRLKKRFPDIVKKTSKTPPRSKHPLEGSDAERTVVRRALANSLDIQVKGNKARLTKQHFRIMKNFGMDIEDPSDVNTFVRENLPKKRRG